jgi:Icc-related predicted phosphoesterase
MIEWLKQRTRQHDPPFDVILYAGDDVDRFRRPHANLFEDIGEFARFGLGAVLGNDDLRRDSATITGDNVFNLGDQTRRLGRFVLVGIEGSPDDENGMGPTLLSEAEIARRLTQAVERTHDDDILIVVSHTPPRDCLDRAVRFSQTGAPRPIGSRPLRDFILSCRRVRLVVCGHAHLCGGQHDTLGAATVVNVASDDTSSSAPIQAAEIIVAADGSCKVTHLQIRGAPGSLFDIWGIGPRYQVALERHGMRSVKALASAEPERVEKALGLSPRSHRARFLVYQARTLLDGQPRILRRPSFPGRPRRYLDIETDLRGTYCWLVSVAEEDGPARQFFSPTGRKGERVILEQLLAWVEKAPDDPVLWYGSQEKWVLPNRFRSHRLRIPRAIARAVDVYTECFARRNVTLPLGRFTLKDVAKFFGYRFRNPDMDGFLASSEYERALRLPAQSRVEIFKRLKEYGEDDVLALRHIVSGLAQLVYNAQTHPEEVSSMHRQAISDAGGESGP